MAVLDSAEAAGRSFLPREAAAVTPFSLGAERALALGGAPLRVGEALALDLGGAFFIVSVSGGPSAEGEGPGAGWGRPLGRAASVGAAASEAAGSEGAVSVTGEELPARGVRSPSRSFPSEEPVCMRWRKRLRASGSLAPLIVRSSLHHFLSSRRGQRREAGET